MEGSESEKGPNNEISIEECRNVIKLNVKRTVSKRKRMSKLPQRYFDTGPSELATIVFILLVIFIVSLTPVTRTIERTNDRIFTGASSRAHNIVI